MQIYFDLSIICILSIGLRSFFGTNDAQRITPNELAMKLRLAYERAYFEETEMFSSLCGWQDRTGYIVLA